MIDEFLQNLKKMLATFEMTQTEKEEIIKDYEEMAQEALDSGKTEEEVVTLFGAPADIKADLLRMYPQKDKTGPYAKLVALSPFLSLIAFILLGVFFAAWHPSWLVFLLVPITGIFNSRKHMGPLSFITAISPFMALIAFFLTGYFTGVHNPTWLIFFIVPLCGFLAEKTLWKRLVLVLSLLVSCGLYLVVFYTTGDTLTALPAFLVVIVAGLTTGNIVIGFDGLGSLGEKGALILGAALFVLFGYLFDAWVVSWLFFLLLPVTSILQKKTKRHLFTALSPFVSLTVFMLVGYFTGYWHPGWLAFLLVPITAIVENA